VEAQTREHVTEASVMGYAAPIVIGLDGSTASVTALRWAASRSHETATPLVIVHAYAADPRLEDRQGSRLAHESHRRVQATGWVRDALAGCTALPWRTHLIVVEGPPANVLTAQARDAAMLVIGSSYPRSSLRASAERVRGSCEDMATCPVVVVPSEGTIGLSPVVAAPGDGEPPRDGTVNA
jgi:nucleotide-binding universal stress UspA family protein